MRLVFLAVHHKARPGNGFLPGWPSVFWRFYALLPKPVLDPALLHNSVGGVAGFDFSVYGDVDPGDGTVPDLMVALSGAHKMAAVGTQ